MQGLSAGHAFQISLSRLGALILPEVFGGGVYFLVRVVLHHTFGLLGVF